MSSVLADRLRELAATDPSVAPLARLQAEALAAADDPVWGAAVPELAAGPPWLDGTTLRVPVERLRQLLQDMGVEVVDPLPLIEATVAQQAERFATLVGDAPPRPLEAMIVILQVASLPLLLACGAHATPRLANLIWEHGACPVCAAWPILLEVRGLERQRWLRCGRCGSGWQQINALCPFCGTDDYQQQTFIAPEAERETRQAQACANCHGYLKVLTTLAALGPGKLLLRDLQSLELDVAALEQGYVRPAEPARVLQVKVEALPASVARG